MAKRGRKTNEQKYQEQIDRFLTVKELKKILDEFPDDAPVGVIGHFGEFYGYDKYDFTYSENRHCYITPNGSWRNDSRKEINVVEVHQIDIGPDPD